MFFFLRLGNLFYMAVEVSNNKGKVCCKYKGFFCMDLSFFPTHRLIRLFPEQPGHSKIIASKNVRAVKNDPI